MRKASTHEAVFDGPWDAQTTVHEYGGGHAVAYNGTVYFSNLPDNRVYQVLPGGTPKAVTPGRVSIVGDASSDNDNLQCRAYTLALCRLHSTPCVFAFPLGNQGGP